MASRYLEISVVHLPTCEIFLLWRQCGASFNSSIETSILAFAKMTMGVMSKHKVRKQLVNLLAAASTSKPFEGWASLFLPMVLSAYRQISHSQRPYK